MLRHVPDAPGLMPTATRVTPVPVFGISSKLVGTIVFLSDGTVLEMISGKWCETTPLPRTARALDFPEVPRVDD